MKIENIADLQVPIQTARGGTLTAAARLRGQILLDYAGRSCRC